MPLLALISDIHGNIDPLEMVLADIKKQGATEILCLGDIVGYGAAPSECLEVIRQQCSIVVKGNHDQMAAENGILLYPERVAAGIRYARTTLSREQLDWLRELPLAADQYGLTIVHASLARPEEFSYLNTDEEARRHFIRQFTPFCFNGHTHIASIALDGRGIEWGFPDEQPIRFRESHRCAVNVGSVGQPRDGDPRACYGLFDAKDQEFILRRVPYDIKKAQSRMREAMLPWENASRLAVGG